MEKQQVASSCIAEVAYERTTETLAVRFHAGRAYLYYGVPEPVYRKLLSAESVGKCFNDEVRSAGYSCRRLQ